MDILTLTRSDTSVQRTEGADGAPDKYRFVASTDAEARDGHVYAQNWDLSEYKANPVVLYVHNLSLIHI